MRVAAFIFGLTALVMAPVSASAQARTPQIAPLGPTLMLPPATAPRVAPPASMQVSPGAICHTHQEWQCDVTTCRSVPVTSCSNQ